MIKLVREVVFLLFPTRSTVQFGRRTVQTPSLFLSHFLCIPVFTEQLTGSVLCIPLFTEQLTGSVLCIPLFTEQRIHSVLCIPVFTKQRRLQNVGVCRKYSTAQCV